MTAEKAMIQTEKNRTEMKAKKQARGKGKKGRKGT